MRGNGRVPSELARKREQAALDLAASGMTEAKIAAELAKQSLGEVTQQAVSKMLLRVEKRLLAQMSEQVKLMKVRQTRILEEVVYNAMTAWEESKKPQKSLTTKQGAGENGQPGPVLGTELTLRDSHGDPRFLEQARKALADIRKIWGVDEPARTRSDITGRPVDNVVIYVPDDGRNPPAE
jgi:hypothetical protein